MAFVPAPNIVQVEVRALFAGQKVENRFMIDTLAPVTPASVQAAAELVLGWAVSTYFPLLPNAIELVECFARDMSDAEGAQFSAVPEAPVVGGQASIPMPNEVSFCVSFKTSSSGRSARGRAYVLGIPQPLVVGNVINATLRGQLRDAFVTLRSAINDMDWLFVIVSYTTNLEPRPGGPVYFPITSIVTTDNLVDSQRRRKPGNGS